MLDIKIQLFIVFVVTGMLLVAAEIFLPGAILGVIGGMALVAAAILGFAAFGPAGGSYALAGIVVFTILMMIIWMRYFPGSRIGKKIIVALDLSTSKSADNYSTFLGKEGESASELRPAGFAILNGKRIDVVTQGEMISKGEKIKVVKIDGGRVIVQAVEKLK